MKTKNNLTTGIIIGICVIVLPLILMGTIQTNTESQIGKYQISTSSTVHFVFETIIDTRTGEVISRERRERRNYHWID